MRRNDNQPSSSNNEENPASAQHGSGFANQKTLKLLECIKLKNLVSSLVSFHSLTTLEVSRCHELENLVTPSIANSMEQLKRMIITDCKKIEEIIACEGKEVKKKIEDEKVEKKIEDEKVEKKIEYKQLKSLRLQWLPSLKSFCSMKYSRKYSISFPHMDELIVKECPKLEIFSDGKIHTPKLKKVCRTGYDKGCQIDDDLNTAIKKLNAEKRDTLEELGPLRWNLGNLWAPLSGDSI